MTQAFQEHRPPLVGIAYQMLGEITDAEDVVQDAWLRWSQVETATITNPRAYLVRITTRLAIDRLRRANREAYIGPWLPEPLRTDDASTAVELADAVSSAMLVVLETLSPLERTVFVLREAFDVPCREIAEILDRRDDTVRQLARRARHHGQQRSVRFDSDATVQREINGGPGIVITSAGVIVAAITLRTARGLVQRIEVVANPEKLAGVRDHR